MTKIHCLTSLIILLVLLSFYPVFGSFFLADDAAWLTQAEKVQHNILKIFEPIRWGYFRPFTVFVVTILYSVFSLSPIYYNIFSLSLHIVNSLLIFLLAGHITKNRSIAILSSLFFSVSVSHHQAVLWMADLGDLLSGLFFLLALYFYLQQGKKTFYLLSLLFYLLGLCSKEIVATFILIIILYDIIFLRKFNFKFYIPFWIITLFYIFIYAKITGFPKSFLPVYSAGWHFAKNLLVALVELFLSLTGRLSHPAFLNFIKNYPALDFGLWFFNILFQISAVIILFMILRNVKQNLNGNYSKIITFSLLWIIIILLPLSFFTYLKDMPGAFFARYRFFYLPSAGYAILVSSVIIFTYDKLKTKNFVMKFLFSSLIFSIISSNVISNNLLSREFKYRSKIQETIVREVGEKCKNCNKIYLLNFPEGMHIRPYLQDFMDLYYGNGCKVFFKKDIKDIEIKDNACLLILEKDGRIADKTSWFRKITND